MSENLGCKFIQTVSAMYRKSTYIPKVAADRLGDPIDTYYGVTQGRRSSTNFFTFLIRDMPLAVSSEEFDDFMDPHNCAQMADDTIIAAETRISQRNKFDRIYDFSCDKGQTINVGKTLFINMSKTPDTQDITCNNDRTLSSLEPGKSVLYLGMHLYHTNSLKDIIEYNLNKRMFNIARFKSWLEVNENTPFVTKLLVIDNCVLSSILYGFEAWGDLSFIAKRLETIELDLLKSALGVRISTPNNLVYHELKRGSITTKLMDRQQKFVDKIKSLDEEEALVKCLWNKCQHLHICQYYNDLTNNNYNQDILNRASTLRTSDKSMDIRYCDLIGLDDNNCIYESGVIDSFRKVVSRWRLSNFKLAIETGRYSRPKTERERRICRTCLVVEDEKHAIFECRLYNEVRHKYPEIFKPPQTVKTFLNPKSKEDLYNVGKVLFEIEKIQEKFNF